MTQPAKTARSCDCPCHDGADVFHVVTCCGSILGERGGLRRAAREAASPEAAGAEVLAASASAPDTMRPSNA
jgi:hypothetical protein